MTSAEKAAAAIRKTMAAEIRKSAFLMGARPELEAVRAELVRVEAEWQRADAPRAMIFHLAGSSLVAQPTLARLLFTGDVTEGLRVLAQGMESTPSPALLLHKQVFDGFAVLCKTTLDASDGPLNTNTLELVTTDGYSWLLTHFIGAEPIVLVNHVEDIVGSTTTELLRRAVVATVRKLEDNEASPIVQTLRAAGFGTAEK